MSQTTRETIAEIWSIAWPMIVAYVSVPAMGIADTAVMGHLENPSHLGDTFVHSQLRTSVDDDAVRPPDPGGCT